MRGMVIGRELVAMTRPCRALFTGDELVRDRDVGLGADALHVVEHDRLSETRGFSEPDIAWDDAVEDLRAELLARVSGDLA